MFSGSMPSVCFILYKLHSKVTWYMPKQNKTPVFKIIKMSLKVLLALNYITVVCSERFISFIYSTFLLFRYKLTVVINVEMIIIIKLRHFISASKVACSKDIHHMLISISKLCVNGCVCDCDGLTLFRVSHASCPESPEIL